MRHMQTLQRSTFDVISGVSAEENTLAFCAIAQVAIGDVVLAEWHNTTYRCPLSTYNCRCIKTHKPSTARLLVCGCKCLCWLLPVCQFCKLRVCNYVAIVRSSAGYFQRTVLLG